jgi:hypothetical protein
MTQELWAAIVLYAVKFGLQAAIDLARSIAAGGNIDTAIAALERAEAKSAQSYLDDAKATAALTAAGVAPTP